MANLIFVKRPSYSAEDIAATPRLQWALQEKRDGFLHNGAISIEDGFVTTIKVGGDGVAYAHTTTYAVVRPLAFYDPDTPPVTGYVNPGDKGLVPLQSRFRTGSVGIRLAVKNVILLTSSQSHQFVNGHVSIVTTSNLGSVTKFAVWTLTGQRDPVDGYIESATDVDSGGVTQAYVRMNAVFVPNPKTRYLAVGARVYSVPNTGTWRSQYFKKWMVEKANVGGSVPSPKYGQAREVVVYVKPDRLNLTKNPGFAVDTTYWTGLTRAAYAASPSGYAGQITLAGAASGTVTHTLSGLKVGQQYTASVLVASTNPIMVDGLPFGTTPVRRTVTFVAATTSPVLTFTVGPAVGSTIVSFYAMIVERGPSVGTYFAGSTSADTVWETGGTTGLSRSYLYKNKADRYAAIKRVLADNVPLGIGVAEPVFGTLPADW